MASKSEALTIEEVHARFDQWRKNRTRVSPIPAELWSAAVEVARLHGIARTAATLHLDGGKLKRIMAGGQSSRKLKPTFVELLTPPPNSLVECVIELTGNRGTVRVHLKSASARDVATVTGALWEAVS